jgi:hypothetical protein
VTKTLFVANPGNPENPKRADGVRGLPLTWGGDPLLVKEGISEWPEHLALHIVGKFPLYGLSFHNTKAEAAKALEK